MNSRNSFYYLTLCLLISITFTSQSAVVKGKLISRQYCTNIDYISELKIDNQVALHNYQTINGQFVLENIEKGKHSIEITCQGHYTTLILDVIVKNDTVILPSFKLHPYINDTYTDLMRVTRGNRPEKSYRKNGKLEAEGKYKWKIHIKYVKGYFLTVKNGLWKYYYDSGNIETEIYYKNGTPNGIIKEYDTDGKIFFIGYFCDGMHCGKWTYYGKDGGIDYIAEFIDGKQVIKFAEIYDKECVSYGWIG